MDACSKDNFNRRWYTRGKSFLRFPTIFYPLEESLNDELVQNLMFIKKYLECVVQWMMLKNKWLDHHYDASALGIYKVHRIESII